MKHCISCKFYLQHIAVGEIVDVCGSAAQESEGTCHRRSPETQRSTEYDTRAVWPVVFGSCWCGEYEGVNE